jgi:hypothetical protein
LEHGHGRLKAELQTVTRNCRKTLTDTALPSAASAAQFQFHSLPPPGMLPEPIYEHRILSQTTAALHCGGG